MKHSGHMPLLVFCLFAGSISGAVAQEFKATLGQSSAVMTGKWQFHTGDDMRWSDPAFDDSKWERITAEEPWGAQGHPGYTGFAWYRRALEIDGVTGPVSIYVPHVDGSYELFWNGQRIGLSGRLPPHATYHPAYHSPSAGDVFELQTTGERRNLAGELAIRLWTPMLRSYLRPSLAGGLRDFPAIGNSDLLQTRRSAIEMASEQEDLFSILQGFTLLLAGLIAMAMWLVERKRRLYLWLGVILIGMSLTTISAFSEWPRFISTPGGQIYSLLCQSITTSSLWMFAVVLFGLDRERNWYRATLAILALYGASTFVRCLIDWFWFSGWRQLPDIDRFATMLSTILELYLVLLLTAGVRRLRAFTLLPLALACICWVIPDLMFGAGRSFRWSGVTTFYRVWRTMTFRIGPYYLTPNTQLGLLVMLTLIWTVYREQARERRRQLFVESEMRSAQEIQQVLVPEETPAVPGFAISSLYWPAGEVGGDLFQVLPGDDGGVTVVLADVSGKGLKAAMTVSLIVGAVRTLAETTTIPMVILGGLNRRLIGRTDGGFSTCLVMHVSAAGEVTMANAGHLSPFVNGEAMELEGSLPLGIAYDAEFSESRFTLGEGDEVTLYTDGVLEAQNGAGELFGFARCEELMRRRPSVQEVAEAAKTFGQEDDITVVKIARVHADDAQERMSVDVRTFHHQAGELAAAQSARA